jgi:hypothetical protein
MAGRALVLLGLVALACAPSQSPPTPDVPRFTPRVPDDQCPSVLPDTLPCAPAWIERCDLLEPCRATSGCLDALGSVPNSCARGDGDGACLPRVERVLRRAHGELELGALIEASLGPRIAQQYPAGRVIGGMDRAQLDGLLATEHEDAFAAIWSATPVQDGSDGTESRWTVLQRFPDDAFAQLVLEGGESPWADRVLALGEQHPEDLAHALQSKMACHAGRSSLRSLAALLRRWPADDREIVRDALEWPDWQLQVVAIDDVVRNRDVRALPILDTLAREHWSAIVSSRARAASEVLRTPTLSGDEAQRRIEKQTIDDDHGVNACRPDPGGRWYVQTRHGPREFAAPRREGAEAPQGIPAIPRVYGGISRALRITQGWFVGTSRWEGEGSLLFVHTNGRVEEVLRSPVAALLDTPFGTIAITDDHLSAPSIMTLGWSEPTEHLHYERGPYIHFHVRLPAGVRGYELDEHGVLTIETYLGVVELDRAGAMKLLPCAATP